MALFALTIERMADNALDPVQEFEFLLGEIQIEGMQRLQTLLPEHFDGIGQLMLSETKYNWHVQDPEFATQTPVQQDRMLDELRVTMRDIADRMLTRPGWRDRLEDTPAP